MHAHALLQVEHDGFGNGGREGVAVVMPRGIYKVTKMVEIYQSNVVLRGEGVSGQAGRHTRRCWPQQSLCSRVPHQQSVCQPDLRWPAPWYRPSSPAAAFFER